MTNFNMDLSEADCESRRWIELAQNRLQCIGGVEPFGSNSRTLVPYYCRVCRVLYGLPYTFYYTGVY
jgi:hypothetical protein